MLLLFFSLSYHNIISVNDKTDEAAGYLTNLLERTRHSVEFTEVGMKVYTALMEDRIDIGVLTEANYRGVEKLRFVEFFHSGMEVMMSVNHPDPEKGPKQEIDPKEETKPHQPAAPVKKGDGQSSKKPQAGIPNTGDEHAVLLWMMFLCMSLGVLLCSRSRFAFRKNGITI